MAVNQKRIKMLVLATLLLFASGCGQQSIITDKSSVASLNDNKVYEIEFWHTYSDAETQILEDQLIPAFEKVHPDVRVHPVRQANDNELKYTLISKASSDRAPDVVRMDIAWVPEFSQSGLLLPLGDNPDYDEVMSALQSNTGSAGYYEGQHYSLPVNMNTKVAIYNRALLKEAGLTDPPASFAEVIELAKKHRFKIGIGGLDAWKSLPYIYALGGIMTSDDYKKASGYLNSDKTIHAVEQLVSLYNEQLIDRNIISGGADNWEGVKTGRILVTDEGPWFYSIFEGDELKRAIDSTVAVPFSPDYGPASILGGEDLVIMQGAEYPAQAWAFMKWMVREDSQIAMSKTGLIPTNMKAKVIKAQDDSFIPPFTQALDQTFLRPPVKHWGKIEEIYLDYMIRIFQGELSAREGLTEAAEQIDKWLE